ncbi:hypothetical protein Patl1_18572 [Pistacia atlantica]|uniref:Uncharacterized protein n=1 Tax=Pistacia atlantica TaxID=434234 RepID=A0ACC1BXN3_9ROSI|nr:hypothetical protein Patl1_18572 [Pistacia atlantica]
MLETDGANNMEDNSSSQTENSSSDDPRLLESICNDDSLLNSLWMDEPPFVDGTPWNNQPPPQNISNMSLPSWEDNCSWLLDCQDFGIHDFGIDCFSDIEFNTLTTLEMGESKH